MENSVVFIDLPKTRVCLRPVEKSDLPFFQVMVNDERISRNLHPRSPMSMVDEENWFESIAKNKPGKQACSIVLKKGHKLIGNISIFNIDDRSHTAEIGIAIGEQDRLGKGLGTEATMLWLKYAFLSLNLRQIYWGAYGFNERSTKCAKKCGFVEIARFPKDRYIDGEYHDVVYLMVTKEDWLPLWKEFEKKMKGEER